MPAPRSFALSDHGLLELLVTVIPAAQVQPGGDLSRHVGQLQLLIVILRGIQRPRRDQPGQLQELLQLEDDPFAPVPGGVGSRSLRFAMPPRAGIVAAT